MNWTLERRIEVLLKTKQEQTRLKKDLWGFQNGDDKGFAYLPEGEKLPPIIYPTPDVSPYSERNWGWRHRHYLRSVPTYVDPMSSLAGFTLSFRPDPKEFAKARKNRLPQIPKGYRVPKRLREIHTKYDLISGLGSGGHFSADVRIGFRLGWQGVIEKIQYYKNLNGGVRPSFYEGLEHCCRGIQEYIARHAVAAREASGNENDPELKQTLLKMAECNQNIINSPPATFYEAVQFMAWYNVIFRMCGGEGAAMGAPDQWLYPYYRKDIDSSLLTDDEALLHICCLLYKDNFYAQIGGCDAEGNDLCNELTHIVLDAMHLVKIPTSICLRVHKNLDKEILDKAIDYMFQDKNGAPSFLGDEAMVQGFMRNGYPKELAVSRVRSGCHWCNIPGREYTLNDCVKINLAKIFEVSFEEMIEGADIENSLDNLHLLFEKHLRTAVSAVAEGFDIHLEQKPKLYPELIMSLLCHGPIEKGYDATNGAKRALEYYNMCVDASGLGTTADSFSAIKTYVVDGGKIGWEALHECLRGNYEGREDIRLMLDRAPKFGSGGSYADETAKKLVDLFCFIVKESATPKYGHIMIPGLFSWANTIQLGQGLGATPDGRKAGEPITHGANPNPNFKDSGVLTAVAAAVASVQPNYGNTAPLQLEVDPMLEKDRGGLKLMSDFVYTYCTDLGGTLLNLNIIDKQTILKAAENPSEYPNLIVRVTGFSTYFSVLSDEFRQLIVDRIVDASA